MLTRNAVIETVGNYAREIEAQGVPCVPPYCSARLPKARSTNGRISTSLWLRMNLQEQDFLMQDIFPASALKRRPVLPVIFWTETPSSMKSKKRALQFFHQMQYRRNLKMKGDTVIISSNSCCF
jgi:hypothetical protein